MSYTNLSNDEIDSYNTSQGQNLSENIILVFIYTYLNRDRINELKTKLILLIFIMFRRLIY